MYSDMASWNIQSCQPHTNTFPTITYKHSNINHDDHIIEGNNLNENISQIKKVKGLSYNQLSIIIFVHYERVIDAIRFLYPNVFFIHLNCRPLSLQLCKAIENKWTIMVEFLLHVQQRRPHSIANRCINWFDIKEEWNI